MAQKVSNANLGMDNALVNIIMEVNTVRSVPISITIFLNATVSNS